jgi:hypothetical protein
MGTVMPMRLKDDHKGEHTGSFPPTLAGWEKRRDREVIDAK